MAAFDHEHVHVVTVQTMVSQHIGQHSTLTSTCAAVQL